MDGYVDRTNPSTGIHDRLLSRALVLRAGGRTAAIVSCDLCWVGLATVAEVRKKAKASGVDALILAATHTHSGPAVADFIAGPTAPDSDYVLSLPGLITDSIRSASERLRPVTAEVKVGNVGLSVNRRLRSLPVDPTLVTLTFQDEQGKSVAGVLNYSCHPTVLGPTNQQISADYPGKVAELAEEQEGGSYVSLFLNGACGDVNPSTCDGYICAGTFLDVSSMARKLVEASRGSPGAKPVGISELGAASTRIGPLAPWGLSFELDAMSLGGVSLLGVPGELFASTGIWLRKQLSPRPLLIAGFANGYAGYFPTPDAFERRDYETRKICWVDASAEQAIRREAADLLEKVCG